MASPLLIVPGSDIGGSQLTRVLVDLQLDGGSVFNVKRFYAAGDGVTDDSDAWQSLITRVAALGGGIIDVPSGTYKITKPLTGVKSNMHFRFAAGAIVDGSGVPANNNLFSTVGSTGDSGAVSLTADASAGTRTVSVAAGAETAFTVGGFAKLGSHKQWSADVAQADPTMDGWRGEIVIVSSVSSGSVTFAAPFFDSYAVADAAYIAPMTMLSNISISGPGVIIGGGNTSNSIGFKLDRCMHLRVRDVTMMNFDVTAFQVRDGFDVEFDGVTVLGGVSSTTNFYGIAWQYASQHCTMVNCVFRDVRHAATLDQVNTIRAGVPRFITYKNCKAYNTTATAYDAHAYGEHLIIEGCESHNSTENGISVRSPSAIVRNNIIVSPGQHGIYLRNQTLQASRYTVSGNHVIGAGLNGINWRTPPEAALAGTQAGTIVDGVVITDNIVVDSVNEGVIVQSASGFNNLTSGVVKGNVVKFNAPAGKTAYSVIRGSGIILNGNLAISAANGMVLDNNSDHCIVVGNNLHGTTTPLTLGTGTGHVSANNGT